MPLPILSPLTSISLRRGRCIPSFFSGTESARFLVNLYGRLIAPHLYNFADEVARAYAHHVEHSGVVKSFRHDERPGDLYYPSLFPFCHC